MFMSRTAKALLPASFTDRRGAADRRAAAREREALMAALERGPALLELTPDGRVQGANARFLALLGMTAEAVLGQPHANLLTEAERGGAAWRRMRDDVARGEVATARLRHTARDGHDVLLELCCCPATGEDGKPGAAIGRASCRERV